MSARQPPCAADFFGTHAVGIEREGARRTITHRTESLVVGRLQAHGAAPYQFQRGQNHTYYVRLLTDRGERVLWGKDLERALIDSATQPKLGELVGARRAAREAVTIRIPERDADGRLVGQREQLAYRSRWIVEKVQFFAERARLARRLRESHVGIKQAVREHPELAATFLTLRSAQQIAERRIADPKDRERFVSLVREAIAGSIQKGQPLPSLRLRPAGPKPAAALPPRRRDDGRTR